VKDHIASIEIRKPMIEAVVHNNFVIKLLRFTNRNKKNKLIANSSNMNANSSKANPRSMYVTNGLKSVLLKIISDRYTINHTSKKYRKMKSSSDIIRFIYIISDKICAVILCTNI
jgi:hypothetical protein